MYLHVLNAYSYVRLSAELFHSLIHHLTASIKTGIALNLQGKGSGHRPHTNQKPHKIANVCRREAYIGLTLMAGEQGSAH